MRYLSHASAASSSVGVIYLTDYIIRTLLTSFLLHRLKDCGHSFCAPCLRTYLLTVRASFMATRPGWSMIPRGVGPLIAMLNNQPLRPEHSEVVRGIVNSAYATMPKPHYSCPHCRQRILVPPVRNFQLQEIVEAIPTQDPERPNVTLSMNDFFLVI